MRAKEKKGEKDKKRSYNIKLKIKTKRKNKHLLGLPYIVLTKLKTIQMDLSATVRSWPHIL